MHVLLVGNIPLRIEALSALCQRESIGHDVIDPSNIHISELVFSNWDTAVIDLDSYLGTGLAFQLVQMLRKEARYSHSMILTHTAIAELEAPALQSGADDHILWPTQDKLLLERLRMLMRRKERLIAGTSIKSMLSLGQITICRSTRQCLVSGNDIRLTRVEFDLLDLFIRRPRMVFDRYQIRAQIRSNGVGGGTDDRSIDSQVTRLRRKLKEAGADGYIRTHYGAGYSGECPSQKE